MMGFLDFTQPGFLLLLLAIPLVLYPYHRKNKKRSRNSLQNRLTIILRIAIALLLIFALAGIRIGQGKRPAAVVYVADLSDSIASDEKAALPRIIEALRSGLTKNDESGVVVFGKEAVIEQPLRRDLKVFDIQSTPSPAGTGIEAALELARTMVSARPESDKKIVLLSDGNQTSGDALREVVQAEAEGITVDVLPLATKKEREAFPVFIRDISGPASVRLDEPFDIGVTLEGKEGAEAVLQTYCDGAFHSEQPVSLPSGGMERYRVPVKTDIPGFHQYRIRIRNPDPARVEETDEGGFVVYAFGRPRILHLTENPGGFLDKILTGQGFEVAMSHPESAPLTIRGLAPYDAVILDNVPAEAFTDAQLQAIADHVEKYAGGLIMIGGSGSFGPGGYAATPVEKVLPVDMALRSRERKPELSVILVLDKSGSMGMEQQKVSKLEMARDAVLRLCELLSPEDELGIIAFDRAPEQVFPLQRGFNTVSVDSAIKTIVAGGGTSILPALDLAYSLLQDSRAEKKYVLLLSDGQAETSERVPLTQRVSKSPIVLSTVGVGNDVDRPLLEELARIARGRAYFTRTGSDLPDIFKREGLLISGKWLVEGLFQPRRLSDHEILRGLGKDDFPKLTGYVATAPKELSDVLLDVENRDPLLVCRRFGLGKTLVFTSDLTSRWTDGLVAWKAFPVLWTQMVRWAGRNRQSESMHPQIAIQDDAAVLTVDAYDAGGNFINFMDLRARLETPDATVRDIPMTQTASGRYEGRFDLRDKGSYLFTVSGDDSKSGTEGGIHFGHDFSKLPEDRPLPTDRRFLSNLSTTGGGKVLNRDGKSAPEITRTTAYSDAWPAAAAVALLLFVLDVIFRRISGSA